MCVNQPDEKEVSQQDSRSSISSQIKPRPLFVAEKKRIDLLGPRPVQTIANASTAQTFYFDTKGSSHGSILIFNTPVTSAQLAAGALAGKCVAGASSIAGHDWNGATVVLGTTSATSQIYTCDGSNPNEPLSRTEKFVRGTLNSGSSYYWVVLGYDKNFVLTHTSGLERFNTP